MLRKLDEVLRLERPLIGVDLETTGTNRQKARVCQLALEIMRPGQPTKEWKTLVNPEEPIPSAATAVHGITDEMVKDAPTFRQLSGNLIVGLTACDFAGTNVRFDLDVLLAEFKRAERKWDYETAAVIDCYRLEQIIRPRSLPHLVDLWLKPGMTPEEVIAEIEAAEGGGAHDALWDIRMSTRVIAAQIAATQSLPRTPRELHDLCSPDWFDAQGKLRWINGELCMNFGAHKETPLSQVPRQYLTKFIQGADFSDKVKKACADAARGIFPTPPASREEEA